MLVQYINNCQTQLILEVKNTNLICKKLNHQDSTLATSTNPLFSYCELNFIWNCSLSKKKKQITKPISNARKNNNYIVMVTKRSKYQRTRKYDILLNLPASVK